jgi:hypothetical protein
MKAWLVEQLGVDLFNTVVGIAAIAMPLLVLLSIVVGGVGWWFGWFDSDLTENKKPSGLGVSQSNEFSTVGSNISSDSSGSVSD